MPRPNETSPFPDEKQAMKQKFNDLTLFFETLNTTQSNLSIPHSPEAIQKALDGADKLLKLDLPDFKGTQEILSYVVEEYRRKNPAPKEDSKS